MTELQITKTSLAPTGPFQGVNPGITQPPGKILLPVTFGTKENYRTENIIFDVADITMPYNGILGRPTLSKFMAVVHHAYNSLKIPSYWGVMTVTTNAGDVVAYVRQVYKEIATASAQKQGGVPAMELGEGTSS